MVRDKIDGNFCYYFKAGLSTNAYDVFGCHLVKDENGKNIGAEFALYAPNAKDCYVVGEWQGFRAGELHMEYIMEGIFYLYLEGDYEWQRYKYLLHTWQDEELYKADPYAFYSQVRPSHDSKVYDIDGFKFEDEVWMYTKTKTYDKPLAIYEMHIGSWKRPWDGREFLTFQEIAPELIKFLKDYGYTHVELMPVYDYPLDMSWGYQGTGYYAITPRYGRPKDLMWFISELHKAGYGVIMDWVPGHTNRDDFGLYRFDGTFLYEYQNEQDRENKEWGTANFDLGKGSTKSFLISNAMFYLKYFHVDGFRIDAVSNIIYYLGIKDRGVNEGACNFLRDLSRTLFAYDDRILLMAEDSSDFKGVTLPADLGGLGFNYKWDLGWMNDTLKYFKLDPIYRRYHHHFLTFSMVYNYNEQFCLPLSHDEVVHMKGSLLNKMPGDQWQQFANFRLLIGYMMAHPGKKLLFMGSELASYDEWHYEGELPWSVLTYPLHNSANRYVKEVTTLYKNEKALFEKDFDPMGFEWIMANNELQSMYVFARYAYDYHDHIIVVMNATPNTYQNYRIGCKDASYYTEIMNSDWDIYNGSNVKNIGEIKVENYHQDNQEHSILVNVPPLGIVFLKAHYDTNDDAKDKKDEDLPKDDNKEVKKVTRKRKTTKKDN